MHQSYLSLFCFCFSFRLLLTQHVVFFFRAPLLCTILFPLSIDIRQITTAQYSDQDQDLAVPLSIDMTEVVGIWRNLPSPPQQRIASHQPRTRRSFLMLIFIFCCSSSFTSIFPSIHTSAQLYQKQPHRMSTSGYTIHVAGLAPETTEDKLHDFFSFCGKLTSVKKSGSTADITFEKLSAMRTSLWVVSMLIANRVCSVIDEWLGCDGPSSVQETIHARGCESLCQALNLLKEETVGTIPLWCYACGL